MVTNPFHIAAVLAKRFKNEQLSEEESRALKSWLEQHPKNQELYNELLLGNQEPATDWLTKLDTESAWQQMERKSLVKKRKKRISVAAVSLVVMLLCFGCYFWISQSAKEDARFVASTNTKHKNDVLPAHLGAKIILANGEELKVADTLSVKGQQELIAGAGEALVEKQPDVPVFNTLVVPTANFFKIVLADGTAVWVNSNSKLRFPTAFISRERRVYLDGEAYFEVAKDASRPFYVETDDMKVRVLGTHFNVSTYEGKHKTSLAEGSVEVLNADKSAVIVPGQSAEWIRGNFKVASTNLQKDLAWKNNEFYFKEDNIVSIAQQLKLWYDLDISFSRDVSLQETYSGEIRRDVRLSEVLNMLEFVSDLDFRLDRNKLLITKK